ncbi:MAG: SUMF1/EgtB/PvdO family nonheme iron enzyme [Anaerolineales bacterium]|nr:SUMF1/EgtB/PvdO family nonheme iron enzyme [Anaerolineales bacterium]
MPNDRILSRRQFIRFIGIAASAAAVGACTSQTATEEPVQPTAEQVVPTAPPTPVENTATAPPPTPTEKPPVEPIFPEMVQVEPGTFQMGSEEGHAFERPVHTVTLTRPFYLGIYAVTFDEYDLYAEDELSYFVDDHGRGRGSLPMTGVDWYSAVAYCNWLSEEAGLSPCYSGGGKVTKCDFLANGYRLPTEAEWEFAARGGIKSQGFLYAGSNDPDEVGWYKGNSGGAAHPVGELKPNELGLYDMSGNRWEWCWDWWDSEYYASSPEIDPTGPFSIPSGSFVQRSRRSSSAVESAFSIRTTYRSYDGPSYPGDNGFRLVRIA